MIKYFEGTVFNVDTMAIVNTVNCTGVMGAGIALEFMLRYPNMYEDYEVKCKDKKIMIGKIDYFKNADDRIIVNFPTKGHFKYPSNLLWIEKGLMDFVKTYKKQGVSSIAFPKLGTNNGGLKWEDVKTLMEKYLSNLDIEIYICLDNKREAEGLEKIMLDKFNAVDIEKFAKIVKLKGPQKENIARNMPYNRFWKIADTKSIGKKTYRNIFKHFYDMARGIGEETKQLLLF